MTINEFVAILKSSDMPVRHYNTKSYPDMPYITYTEYQESYIRADNRIDNVVEHIQVDLFTAKNGRGAKNKLRSILDKNGISFEYRSLVENEENNKSEVYVHHIFDCEVMIDEK